MIYGGALTSNLYSADLRVQDGDTFAQHILKDLIFITIRLV